MPPEGDCYQSGIVMRRPSQDGSPSGSEGLGGIGVAIGVLALAKTSAELLLERREANLAKQPKTLFPTDADWYFEGILEHDSARAERLEHVAHLMT
jgi:hypothetical protein